MSATRGSMIDLNGGNVQSYSNQRHGFRLENNEVERGAFLQDESLLPSLWELVSRR